MKLLEKYKVGCIIGTRPEIIKMAPVIFKLKESSWANTVLINTAQHRNLLDDMLELFLLKTDFDLDIMTYDQSLGQLTANLFTKLETIIQQQKFDVLLAAGDTTTVFAASLLAFYHKIPFGHIEAGLRTYDINKPFPEEANRVLTSPLSTWNFAPTSQEKENLLRENIAESKIFVTGNPVIDALFWTLENRPVHDFLPGLENIIVVTSHRRENFENLENICAAVIELTKLFNHLNFVFPVHPNPNVQEQVKFMLENKPRIHLINPLKYDKFAHLMKRAILTLTDSGGIQVEAPALNTPVLVLRDTTERPAILSAGVGMLVGTDKNKIIATVAKILNDKELYSSISRGASPYGDGHSAEKIVRAIKESLEARNLEKGHLISLVQSQNLRS